MSIYLAPKSPSAIQVSPSFKARGITSHTTGSLKDLYHTGVARESQVAYNNYAANISSFISATNNQKKLETHIFGCALSDTTRPLFDLPLPPIKFIPTMTLTQDQIDATLVKLADFDVTYKRQGKSSQFILRRPTYEIATKLNSACIDFIATQPEEIMPGDSICFRVLLRILSEFLATNTYPAFSTPPDENDLNSGNVMLEPVFELTAYAKYGPKAVAKMIELAKKAGFGEEEEDMDVDKAKESDYDFDPTQFHKSLILIDQDTIVKCKPSPLPMSYNVGSLSEFPGSLPGRLFPYFHGLNFPDKVTLRKILLSRFVRNLGNTLPDIKASFKYMRRSLDRVASTRSGQALAHLYKGMDLALESQTRMFVIFEDSEYLGFALLGERFFIYDGEEFLEPQSAEELIGEVSKLSTHKVAMEDMAKLLSGLDLKAPVGTITKRAVESKDLSRSSEVIREIRLRKFEEDDKEEMVKITRRLRYKESYYLNTPDRILWAIEEITARKDLELNLDVPQYIPTNVDLLDDKLFRTLLAFGPDAPSFLTNGGRDTFNLAPIHATAEGASLPTNVIIPPKLHIPLKSVTVAFQDWKKMLKDKEFTMDFKERAGKNRCMVISQVNMVTDIMVGLCAAVGQTSKGKKRARDVVDDDTPEAGPSKRSDRRAPRTGDDFLALF
jgi:hypothetical protein